MLLSIARLLVGILFIISGAIKANDPVGFGYKLKEYFEVFGMEWLVPTALPLAILLVIAEMLLGLALLVGYMPKFTSLMILLMIVFFTFLTFYSAYFNKVTDCGCFGDALKLTPWESFWKDIVLLVLIGYIFWKRKEIKPLMSERGQAATMSLGAIAFVALPLVTYSLAPVIDFRPFKEGANIPKDMTIPPGAPMDSIESIFIYTKGGTDQEFDINHIPEEGSGWTYKDRKDKVIRKGYEPKIHGFTIETTGGDDYTEDFLQAPKILFVVSLSLPQAREAAMEELEGIARWAEANNTKIIGLTASTADEIAAAKKQNTLPFEWYLVDGTILKTMTRANPGLMYLRQGVVKKHWHARNLPSAEELTEVSLK